MTIVIGNHDILPQTLFLECDIKVFKEDYIECEFVFTHHPKAEPHPGQFVFAGHLHPCFILSAKGRQSVRLPCFVIDENQAVLPSFGVFTGGHAIASAQNRKIFVIAEQQIFQIPKKLSF